MTFSEHLSTIQYSYSRLVELYRLNKATTIHSRPHIPELVEINHKKAIWKVLVQNSTPVFMSLNFGYSEQDFFVVYIDTEKFYKLWLKSSPLLLHKNTKYCVCRAHMPLDRKFGKAAECFIHGQSNPVPIALGGVNIDAYGGYNVSFIDGITRTYWLIAHRCRSFPIRVYKKEQAELLHAAAGIGNITSSIELKQSIV